MIKVIIADDEEKVCQLIYHLIDWKSVDMEIVGVAHNGIETLELIKTLRPDLVITDIRMPGYDGLELINLGKQVKEDMDFIIISGYSHFEYAQSAIKYGVSDYLLKPIKKNELLETLNKIRKKYMQRAERLSVEERMKIRLQSDIDKLRAGFFLEKLLQNDPNREKIDIERCNEDHHLNFSPGCFQIFIVKLDYEYENLNESSIRILEDKVAQILRSSLKNECFDMEICFHGSRIYCVLNYEDSNRKTVRKQLKACMDELMVQKSIYDRIEFTIGLGSITDDIDQLKSSMKVAEMAVQQRLIEGTEKLIENVHQKSSTARMDIILSDLMKSLEASMEILDSGGAIEAIEAFKESLLKENISGHEILRTVISAFNIYLMLLRKHQLNIENAEQLYEKFSLHADLCSSVTKLFDCLSKFMSESLDAAFEERKQAYIKPIRTAKQYIQQNYMKPITLKEVSSVVGFNDSYFSSLFKKETGKNFMEYLLEVRMNRAKELLKETNLSIAGICEKIGYSDLKHFTKSFKKYTGLNPNEFRKIYS
ncbi:MAG TPA: response regulator [Thermoanaerobacterales bacterium]|nr:response regulator [Thermoanaerobacterales bacterium]